MSQPLVMLIVPVYKVENFLHRCLDSIIAQTYTNFEAILIDDGSPDRCGKICDEYAHRDIRFHVIHQKNAGVGAARNTGLQTCLENDQVKYIFFIDSDDYIAPDTLQVLVNKAQDGNFDIVMSGYNTIENNGKICDKSSDWECSVNTADIQRRILCDQLPNFPWGKLFKASLWQNVRYPENMRMEDLYIIPKIFFKAERICLITAPLCFYDQENCESAMNNMELKPYVQLRYDWFLAWVEHENLARRHAPECQTKCIVEATHKAVRAGLMNQFVNILSAAQYDTILSYLRRHENIPVKLGLHAGRYLLLHGNPLLLKIVGWIQCWITVKRMENHRGRNK